MVATGGSSAERTIDQWNSVDQSLFEAEWPLEAQRLDMLRRRVAEGALMLPRLERCEELERPVEQNRRIVDRMLPGWITGAESLRRAAR
jgi:hypothetical protein